MDTARPDPLPPVQPTFGALLRQYRLAAGVSQEALAERAGMSVQGLSALENGRRQAPYRHTVTLLARALGLSVAETSALEAAVIHVRAPAPATARVPGLHDQVPSPELTTGGDASPSVRAAPAARTNLAVQLTSFIGREREQAEVRALLDAARLVTLTGTGGAGKTRLALAVAGEVLDQYPEGVWLLELAPLADPALVAQAVVQVLGLREEAGRPVLESLCAYLAARRLLLVLDNCEHLVGACADLVEGLLQACTHLRILATSREGLGVAGERLYRVPPLPAPPLGHLPPPEELGGYAAVSLFVARAQERQVDFVLTAQTARAVALICARLDGLPLAIELAAAWVGSLPVEAIAARLDDRFRLLTAGPRTAVPRQRTLRATLDWSYDLLSEGEQRLLDRLSVFAGGCTLDAVAAVCGGEGIEAEWPGGSDDVASIGEWAVLELLGGLVNKSLVLLEVAGAGEEHGRYRLLETVRQYGWNHLSARAEAAAVRDRHLEWCVALAEVTRRQLYGPEQRRGLDRLEAEHDNLRAALGWAVEREAWELGIRLAGAVSRFWLLRGYISEGLGWLEATLGGGGAASTRAHADALLWAGTLAFRRHDSARALARYEESLAAFRDLGHTQWIAIALGCLGDVAGEQGDHVRALALREENLALWREQGEPLGIAFSLEGLAMAVHGQGDYARAAALLEESLPVVRAQGDGTQIANVLINVGIVALDLGEHGRAVAHLHESLRLSRESGARPQIADGIEMLARVEAARGQSRRAALLGGAAEARREALGVSLYRPEQAGHDRAAQAVLAALGAAAFAAAWAEGRAMTEEQAVAYALEASCAPTSPPRTPASARERQAAQAAIGQRLDAQEDEVRTERAHTMPRHAPSPSVEQPGAVVAPSARRLSRTERQAWALAHLRAVGELSPRTYAGALAVSVDTALIDLRELLAHGLVRPEGTTRDRRYVLRLDEA
jgi:non-specific serine/threonine protein kinase